MFDFNFREVDALFQLIVILGGAAIILGIFYLILVLITKGFYSLTEKLKGLRYKIQEMLKIKTDKNKSALCGNVSIQTAIIGVMFIYMDSIKTGITLLIVSLICGILMLGYFDDSPFDDFGDYY